MTEQADHDCDHGNTQTVDVHHYHGKVQKEVFCEDCDHHLLLTFTKDEVEVLDPTP
jgi:hypothetical protein